jgi:hypothetical protein
LVKNRTISTQIGAVLDQSVGVRAVQRMLGHVSASITLDVRRRVR